MFSRNCPEPEAHLGEVRLLLLDDLQLGHSPVAVDVEQQSAQRLVEGRIGPTEPVDPGPVAEGAIDGIAEGKGAVLGSVVIIDLQVAAALQLEVPSRMEGEGREHVIEKADSGLYRDHSLSVEGEASADGRLLG